MFRIIFFFFLSFLSINCFSEELIKNATTDELIEGLNPNSIKNLPNSTTRGLRNLTPEERKAPSLNLVIQFEFNSSTLSNESKPLLNNLIQAMNSYQLKSSSFIIEGHTDGVGAANYNMRLSLQRATSVVSYLVANGITKDRLKPVGKGSTELLIPNDPEAAENRRVKVSLY